MNSLSNQTTHVKAIGQPRRPRSGAQRRKASKNKKTSDSNRPKPAVPSKLEKVLATEQMVTSTEMSAYRNATGGSNSSNMEATVEMVDYLDVSGGWTSVGYNPLLLPGYTAGCSVQILSSRFDVLPPATNANNATNNVLVLSGVLMDSAGLGTTSALLSNKQTFISPSVTPSWHHVFNANLRALTDAGYTVITNSQTVEIGRLCLIAPDTGAVSTQTTLQVKVTLKYAITQPLSTSAFGLVSTGLSIVAEASGTGTDLVVFPRFLGTQNRV